MAGYQPFELNSYFEALEARLQAAQTASAAAVVDASGRSSERPTYVAGPLIPPLRDGERTNTCMDAFDGMTIRAGDVDEANPTCTSQATDEVRTLWAVVYRTTDDVAQFVDFAEDRGDEVDRRLFLQAWAFLIDNIDLIRWAVCLVKGPNAGAMDNIPSALTRTQRRVHVVFDPVWIWTHNLQSIPDVNWSGWGGVGGGELKVGVSQWAPLRAAYVHGETNLRFNGLAADMACAILHTAAVLVHELAHVTLIAATEGLRGDCDRAYLIQSAFEWAMWRRYPGALSSACCLGTLNQLDSTLFGDISNGTPRIGPRCLGPVLIGNLPVVAQVGP